MQKHTQWKQYRCWDKLTQSINYVLARLLAVSCNEDIWTADEECDQRRARQHASDRTYTNTTHTQKGEKTLALPYDHSSKRKTRCYVPSSSVIRRPWKCWTAHAYRQSVHSVSAIMRHVEREDLEHPYCAEGLFSRARRVSACFLLLITEQLHWR